MALPPIEDEGDLEAADDEPLESEEDMAPATPDVDPMFAADMSEAFPELDDAQLAAIQRAVLGLISMGGGGGMAPPAAPMGF